jgi:hypothetical protein
MLSRKDQFIWYDNKFACNAASQEQQSNCLESKKCHECSQKISKKKKNEECNTCCYTQVPRSIIGPKVCIKYNLNMSNYQGVQGPPGPNINVPCVDFYSRTANIAGAPGVGFFEFFDVTFPSININLFATGIINGIAPGIPASPVSAPGVIVPGNVQPNIYTAKNSSVIYNRATNAFVILRSGLYEITYYIQGTLQVPCPTGITFGVIIDNNVIPQSAQTIRTGVQTAGQGFNISKTFCVFVANDSTLMKNPKCTILSNITNSLQISVLGDILCASIITTASNPVPGPFGNFTQFTLSPAGTLQPDNAVEIKFMRISDTCE